MNSCAKLLKVPNDGTAQINTNLSTSYSHLHSSLLTISDKFTRCQPLNMLIIIKFRRNMAIAELKTAITKSTSIN